ncbi:MAG: hypothetical protein B6I36_06930 [Desulfobacteraceae bacterium 4572_35.1]|nr:MAG: hypothetical protein B6I36_06930 [Desulfobacteraceae bacterium 4572_35.1]
MLVRKKRWLQLLLLGVVIAVLLAGCAGISITPGCKSSVDKDEMLLLLKNRQQRISSLSMLTRVKLNRKGKKWSSTQALLIDNHRRMRVDMLNFFGQLTMQLSVVGTKLQAYIPTEKLCYNGLATNNNIERFTGLPLAVDDLIALLLEKLPPSVLETVQPVTWEHGLIFPLDSGASYKLTIVDQRVHEVEYRINSYVVYQMRYTGFTQNNLYSRHLKLQFPMDEMEVTLSVDDAQLNQHLSVAQFALSPPVGTVEKALSEL